MACEDPSLLPCAIASRCHQPGEVFRKGRWRAGGQGRQVLAQQGRPGQAPGTEPAQDEKPRGAGKRPGQGQVVAGGRPHPGPAFQGTPGEVRRQAFGFALPSLALFDKAEGTEKLDRVESILKAARQGADGKWILQLENGAVWRQTDADGPARRPRPGMTVSVRSAAMGSFLVSVDGQAGFRGRRDE